MRLLLLTAAAVFAPLANAADDPKAVIEKAIKAHGGADVLKKYPAQRSTFRGTVTAMGMEIEIKGEALSLLPDKGKVKGTLTVAGQEVPLVQVINGKKFTMSIAGNAIPVPDEQVADGLASFHVGSLAQLTPLLTAEYTLKAADKADVEGKPAAGVVVSRKDRPDVTLYFDAGSGRLVKSVFKGKAEDGTDADHEDLYLDYKAVQGQQVPHRTKSTVGGKTTSDITVEKYEPLETLDASAFGAD